MSAFPLYLLLTDIYFSFKLLCFELRISLIISIVREKIIACMDVIQEIMFSLMFVFHLSVCLSVTILPQTY